MFQWPSIQGDVREQHSLKHVVSLLYPSHCQLHLVIIYGTVNFVSSNLLVNTVIALHMSLGPGSNGRKTTYSHICFSFIWCSSIRPSFFSYYSFCIPLLPCHNTKAKYRWSFVGLSRGWCNCTWFQTPAFPYDSSVRQKAQAYSSLGCSPGPLKWVQCSQRHL